jgi:hypothetical protein
MSAASASRKVWQFALLGAAGCLAGWLLGEGFLWGALPRDQGADAGPSLAATPVVPEPPPKTAEAPPPPPPELAARLKAAGAKTGDVQLSLGWRNLNDLDLHCIDPSGEEISFRHKKARSGGELDVDMNATPTTRQPVENIYWPKGGAPLGRYQVYVDYFANHGDPDPTDFQVSVLVGNSRKEFSGSLSRGDARKLIYEFDVQPPKPALRMAAPPSVSVFSGGGNRFLVRLARDYFDGPIRLSLDGDQAGLTVKGLDVPADKDETTVEVEAKREAPDGQRQLRLVAKGGKADAEVPLTLVVEKPPVTTPPWSWRLIVVLGVWTAFLTLGLSLALVAGQNRYLGRPFLLGDQARVVVLGAVAAGLVAGGLGQALLSLFTRFGLPPGVGFVLGWLLLGALVGRGVGFFIPNLSAVRATAAGAAGALLGALFFLGASALAGDVAGRLAGAALLGAAVGLMVALVEVAFRKAWLEVTYAPREVAAVNLGPEPVSLGGDRRACTIPAPGAAPIAFRYWFRDGRVMCEDVVAGGAAPVPPGHERRIGSLTVTVRTAAEVEDAPVPVAPPRPLPPRSSPAPVPVPTPRSGPQASTARPAIEATPFRPTAPPPRPGVPAAEATPFRPASPSAPAPLPSAIPMPDPSELCPRCGVKALGKPGQRFCIACGEYY